VRRFPTWLLIAFVGGVALTATVDAVLLDDSDESAPEATPVRDPSSGAEATIRNLPRCARSQLRLVIEILDGTPTAALQHVRGGLCEAENLPISITIRDGRGSVLGPIGAFRGLWSPNSQHIAQFRYSPACNERGPFLAVVRAGPYTAQQRVPALRCGL
jgi:hypothetical protein